jgi:hypothetical protein
MPNSYSFLFIIILIKEEGKSASYIQEEWSRGCRPRATTDFPIIL